MAASSAAAVELEALCKRVKPARVVALVGDDEREVNVPRAGRSGRWARVAQSCIALDCERVELQDSAHATLAVWVPPGARDASSPSAAVAREEQLLALMLRAQDLALSRQSEQLERIASAYDTLTKALVGRLASMESAYTAVLKTAYETTLARADAEADRILAEARAESKDSGGDVDALASQVLTSQLASIAGGKAK